MTIGKNVMMEMVQPIGTVLLGMNHRGNILIVNKITIRYQRTLLLVNVLQVSIAVIPLVNFATR